MFGSDADRRRVALLLMFGGMMLVLLGAAAYISYEQKRLPPPTTQLSEEQVAALRARVRTPMRILLWGSGLTFGFVVVAYGFLWWSRGFRSRLTRPAPRPTPVEDLWSMHRLPDDLDGEPDEPDRSDETPPGR